MTHTGDLRARVVANTILFLFILQETNLCVAVHHNSHSFGGSLELTMFVM